LKISFIDFGAENNGTIFLFYTDKEGLLLDQKSKNDVSIQKIFEKHIKLSGTTKNKPQSFDTFTSNNNDYDRIIFYKIKDLLKKDEIGWINIGGRVFQYLQNNGVTDVSIRLETTVKNIELMTLPARIAFGMGLKSYSFDKYKTSKPTKKVNLVKFITNHYVTTQNIYKDYSSILNGVNLARDLVNEPSNVLTPLEFVNRIKNLSSPNLKIKILDQKKLSQLGMEALLAVSHGSRQAPYVAIIEHLPVKDQNPLLILGKGVTFDSGGISIKPSGGMDEMKGDMAGAATVVGLMKALDDKKPNLNVIGIVGLVENMTDGNAMRPGDIIKSMSGKTIEILNTDAEGRLVLADLATYSLKNYQPKAIIDLATLTGAILVALGQEMAGLFTNNNNLAEQLIKSGEKTGELLWRMPIGDKYMEMIKSKVADIKNVGGRYAGAITAAEFIHAFVEDTPWAHIDIAGTSITSLKTDVNNSWASGFGVRLLCQYIDDLSKK
jgi:leucyl aminopeptidase